MRAINPAYELLGRLGNEPWLLSPLFCGVSTTIRAMLAGGVDNAATLSDTSLRFGGEQDAMKPFATVGQIAVIPVHGMLLNRFNGAWGYATGYDYIRSAYNAALADPSIRGIVFDVNSPGGDAQGCFEACDVIRAGRAIKPSLAIVNANAMSAAYALASSASKIVVTPSARVGSVGVVTMHVDYSKALADDGIKVTFIFAGDHKVDGNPFQPLPKAVKDAIQGRVDSLYATFVGRVAANRKLDEDAVRATEAAVFDAEQALENGFVDRIEDASVAFSAFTQNLSTRNSESIQMTTKTDETPEQTPVAPAAAAPAAEPAIDAATAERERIAAILNCDEAKDRAKLASHLALGTALSADEARAILSAAAVEKAEAAAPAASPASPFLAAMDDGQHPEVGAGAPAGDEPSPTSAAAIIRDYAAATGVKPKTIQ